MTTIPENFPSERADRMRLFGDLVEPLQIGTPHRHRRWGMMMGEEEIWTKTLPDTDGKKLCILFDPETSEPSGGEGDVFILDPDGSRRREEPYLSPADLGEALRRVYEEEMGQS